MIPQEHSWMRQYVLSSRLSRYTVEHVHVEAGGQAFVGHMEAAHSSGGRERAQLTDEKTIPVDLTLDAVPTSRKVR